MHIVDMNWDSEDARVWASLEKEAEKEKRYGPCEDSAEEVAFYLFVCPEESYKENGSPLRFAEPMSAKLSDEIRAIDSAILDAFRVGF